jgi:hypothetical protein
MKLLITFCALLLLSACGSIDRKFHDPLAEGEPGIIYPAAYLADNKDVPIYENSDLIVLGHGVAFDKKYNGVFGERYFKLAGKTPLTDAEMTRIESESLTGDYYDKAEKRMFRSLLVADTADIGLSVACIAGKGAVEAGPIAGAGPAGAIVGLGILGLHVGMTRHEMAVTPRFRSVAHRKRFAETMVDVNTVTHGAAAVRNAFLCF